jgi:uncharacterized protein YjiK
LCFVALTLACGQGTRSGPAGTAGVAGTPAAGATSDAGKGSGTGGSVPAAGGNGSGGSAGGGAAAVTGGAAGNSMGGISGSSSGMAGASGNSRGGSGGMPPESGGAAGTAMGGNAGEPPTFPPFTGFVPRDAAPIELDGISGASDLTWKPSTDTYFLLTDRGGTFHEYSSDFATVERTIMLENPPADAEGIAYLGATNGVDRFALAVEANDSEILIFELEPEATTLDFATATLQTYVPAAEPSVANSGWEGVAYRPSDAGVATLWACQEGASGQVPIRVVAFPYLPDGAETLSYADESLSVEEPWDAVEQLGTDDLSSVVYDASSDTLLVLSHLGSRLMRVNPLTGDVLDTLELTRSPQYEGVSLTTSGRLVLVSEPNFVEIFQLVPEP